MKKTFFKYSLCSWIWDDSNGRCSQNLHYSITNLSSLLTLYSISASHPLIFRDPHFFFSSQTKTKTSFYCDERIRKVWGEKCHDQILLLLVPRHHRVYAFCICCHYDELERYRRINGNGWVEGRKKDKRAEREWDTVWHLDNLRDIKMEK
jgi:hypothetical protein